MHNETKYLYHRLRRARWLEANGYREFGFVDADGLPFFLACKPEELSEILEEEGLTGRQVSVAPITFRAWEEFYAVVQSANA